MRSVGDPLGALGFSSTEHLDSSPVDQEEGVRDTAVGVFLASAILYVLSAHKLVRKEDVAGRVLGQFCCQLHVAESELTLSDLLDVLVLELLVDLHDQVVLDDAHCR